MVYPLPSDRSAPQPKRYFSQVPTGDPKEVVIRIYIIKATGLQPMDDNGKVIWLSQVVIFKADLEKKLDDF